MYEKMKEYTPSRIHECYFDNGTFIELCTQTGIKRLKGFGRVVWNMCDGKNTIENIVSRISEDKTTDINLIYNECVKLLLKLNAMGLIIMNWDPLYKEKKIQYEE